jgi:hypothetical protein
VSIACLTVCPQTHGRTPMVATRRPVRNKCYMHKRALLLKISMATTANTAHTKSITPCSCRCLWYVWMCTRRQACLRVSTGWDAYAMQPMCSHASGSGTGDISRPHSAHPPASQHTAAASPAKWPGSTCGTANGTCNPSKGTVQGIAPSADVLPSTADGMLWRLTTGTTCASQALANNPHNTHRTLPRHCR